MNFEESIAEAKRLLKEGKQQEDILRFLRASGSSKAESVMIWASASGCGTKEAKRAVHFSRAWMDVQESDEQFHRNLERETKEPEP